MHCLIKEISIFWQPSFGLCESCPKGTDTAPGCFGTAILCVDMLFTHWPFLFIFLNAKYLMCHFWQKVLVIKEETKRAWSRLLERHTQDGTAMESSFFYPAYQSSYWLNEHRRKHIFSWAWKAIVVSECKVYYPDNQLEWCEWLPAKFLLPPVYLAQLTPFFILQSSPQAATWS